jgi:hypothetical protein
MLEHLTYREGLTFLRECRRVLKPTAGYLRIAVPDAGMLMCMYAGRQLNLHKNYEPGECENLDQFDEINDGSAASPTAAGKLWALLHEGHSACYDAETLEKALAEAGFVPYTSQFRTPTIFPGRPELGKQIVRETIDMFPCLSLYVNAVPLVR